MTNGFGRPHERAPTNPGFNILVFGGLILPYSSSSDWRTTRGNVASDLHWSGADDALAAHQQLKGEVERNHSGAVVVGNATRTYNCHAFVHAGSHAWFNDISPFLKDDYYQFTPGQLQINDAVVYVKDGQITHSGFITQLAGNSILKIRSKWGAWPLVEHPPSSVPAIYGSILYYLRRRPAAGPVVGDMKQDLSDQSVSSLFANMLDVERLKELWLASTPEVAELIVKSWPEFSMLQLNAQEASSQIQHRLVDADGEVLFVLSVLAKHVGDREVKALADDRIRLLNSLPPPSAK